MFIQRVFLETIFPHVIPAKAGIQAVFEAVPDPGFRRGLEIKIWAKPSTGVERERVP